MSWNSAQIYAIARKLFVVFGVALVLVSARVAPASTVLEIDVADMLSRCELIFEGEVTEVWSEPSPRGIHTWVRFSVRDVVSGPAVGPSLLLSFLGGRVGDRIEEVSGLRVPELGERGIYFVESLRRFQVNPLYGWDQGRLRIVHDRDGRPRVVTADGSPVVGMGGESSESEKVHRLNSRVARGIRTDRAAPLTRAVSPAALKAALAVSLRAKR
jgi:hypothetical protein